MKTTRLVLLSALLATLAITSTVEAQKVKLGDNAALRYWSAFSQMQDVSITNDDAKQLTSTIDGTIPYSDSRYKDLVEKNKSALDTMARGTALPNCDWGLEYQLGTETPVEYVRKALTLGRLNVLYALHLIASGDKDGAVRVLTVGLQFSRDVANDGTVFATVAAKSLLTVHLRAIDVVAREGKLSVKQRASLQQAVAKLGRDGLDWQSAIRRELSGLHGPASPVSPDIERLIPDYVEAVSNLSMLPRLRQSITNMPPQFQEMIPNPKRVLEEKEELANQLQRTLALLQ